MKMVLADRNAENARRDINGRARSRNTSPNGHHQTDSSDDDSNGKKNGTSKSKAKSEYEAEKIRVGRDYQVVCPDLIPEPSRTPETLNDRALLVWSPTKDIPESKLEEYIAVAKEKYGYNGEQALGMLFWHKHDLERAVLDLANFTPFPDEWTVEDKVLFEQAFQFHGKSFHRIRQMLPDKSIASLVKYYYSWKKTRSRTSVMDRQEKTKKTEGSENGSDHGSNEESDSEEKKWPMHRGIRRCSNSPPRGGTTNDETNSSTAGPTNQSTSNVAAAPSTPASAAANTTTTGSTNGSKEQDPKSTTTAQTNNSQTSGGNKTFLPPPLPPTQSSSNTTVHNCTGCGVACNEINNTPDGQLCNSCHHHWRRTGVLRPTCGPNLLGKRKASSSLFGNAGERHKRRPPRGMYINHDDIVALASSAQTQVVPPTTITPTATALNTKSNVVKSANDDLLASMDREMVSLLTNIQSNKQKVSTFKQKNSESLDDLRPQDNNSRINSRWNNEELLLAVAGVRKFGKDFQAIADTLSTKTEVQVRTFFVNYRRKYNLDSILKEYEQEKQQQLEKSLAEVGTTTTTAVVATETGGIETSKEQQTSSNDSAAGVNGENLNMSVDDDVMEVENPVYDINNVMKSNHKRLSASINIKEKLKDLDEVSIAIIPQASAPANPTTATATPAANTTASGDDEPMDTADVPAVAETTTTTIAAVTTTPINKDILQENINSASNNIVAK